MSKSLIHQQTWQEVDNLLKAQTCDISNLPLTKFASTDLVDKIILACRETKSFRDHLASAVSDNNSKHSLVFSGNIKTFNKLSARISFTNGTRLPNSYLPLNTNTCVMPEEVNLPKECLGFYEKEVLLIKSGLLELLSELDCLPLQTTVMMYPSVFATVTGKEGRPFDIRSSECAKVFSPNQGSFCCSSCMRAKQFINRKYKDAVMLKKNIETDNSRNFLKSVDVTHTKIRALTRNSVNRLAWNLTEETLKSWTQRGISDNLSIEVDMLDDNESSDNFNSSANDSSSYFRSRTSSSFTQSNSNSLSSPTKSVLSMSLLSPTLESEEKFGESSSSVTSSSDLVDLQQAHHKGSRQKKGVLIESKSDILFSSVGYKSRRKLIEPEVKIKDTVEFIPFGNDEHTEFFDTAQTNIELNEQKDRHYTAVLQSARLHIEKVDEDNSDVDMEQDNRSGDEDRNNSGIDSNTATSSNDTSNNNLKNEDIKTKDQLMPQTAAQLLNLQTPLTQSTKSTVSIDQSKIKDTPTINQITGEVETLDEVLHSFEEQARYIDSVIHDFKKDKSTSHEIIVRLAVLSDILKRTSQDLNGKHLRSKLHPETIKECLDMAITMGLNKYEKAFRTRFPLLGLTEVRKGVSSQKTEKSGVRFNVIKAHNEQRDLIIQQQISSSKKECSQVLANYDVMLMFDEKKITPKVSIDHNRGKIVGVADKSLQQSYQIETATSDSLNSCLASHTVAWFSVPTQSGSDNVNNGGDTLAYQSGSYLTAATTSSDMLSQYDEQEAAHMASGNPVVMAMSDRGAPNNKMFEALVQCNARCLDPNDSQAIDGMNLVSRGSLMDPTQLTFLLYDPPHAIAKGIRNNYHYSRPQNEGGTKCLLLRDPETKELVPIDWNRHIKAPYNDFNEASGHLVFERGLNKRMLTAVESNLGKMKVGDAAAINSNKFVRLLRRYIDWVKDGRIAVMGERATPVTAADVEDFKAIRALNVFQKAANDMFDVTNGKDMEKCNKSAGHFVFKKVLDYSNKVELQILRNLPRILKNSVRDVETEIETQTRAGLPNPPVLYHSTFTYQTVGAVCVLGFGLANFIEWYTHTFRKGTKCHADDATTDILEIHFSIIGSRANGPLTAANVSTLEAKSSTKRLIRVQEYVRRGCEKSKTRDQARDMIQNKKGNTTFLKADLSVDDDEDDDSSYESESNQSNSESSTSDIEDNAQGCDESDRLMADLANTVSSSTKYKFVSKIKTRTKLRHQSHLKEPNETVARYTNSEMDAVRRHRKKGDTSITSSHSRNGTSKRSKNSTNG